MPLYVELSDLLFRLNEIVVLIEDSLRLFAERREDEFKRKFSSVAELLVEFGTKLPDEVAEKKLSELEQIIQDQLRHYDLMILNWGLVMMWTTFEAQLQDLILLLFRANEKAFIQWGGDLTISFKTLTDCGDLNTAKESMYSKALREFTNLGIRDRIDTLRKKLNVRDEELFSFAFCNETIRGLLKGWGIQTFEEMSRKRNEIVHERKLPITSIEEIRFVLEVFSRFLMNIGSIISVKASAEFTVAGVPMKIEGGKLAQK
jgi:hypothetical protein